MIRFPCASCGERLSVPEKYVGRKGACPNCGAVNRVPAPGGTPAVAPAQAPFKPVFVELPEPQQRVRETSPTHAPSHTSGAEAPAPQTPYADSDASPVPARNAGAELDQRPDRWTRGPVKIDPIEDEEDRHANGAGLLRFFIEGSAEEDQWVLGHRKQWEVDKRGLPMFAKVGLLLASVLALIGLVWGFFYVLLKIVIAANG